MSHQNLPTTTHINNAVSPYPETARTPDWTVVPASPSIPNAIERNGSPDIKEMKMSKTLSAPALTAILQEEVDSKLRIRESPIEELLNEIRDLKVSHQYQIDQLKLVIEAQSRMIKDIKILRFDQEAMIQSMVTEGKKISPYVEPDKRDLTSLMFPSNSFSFQRNLNWGIRSGKPTPFIAEHTCQKLPGVPPPIQTTKK